MLKKTLNLLTQTQKNALLLAMAVTCFIKMMVWTNYLSQRVSLMFHELGHAVTAWCFAHFAVPRFDYLNGGGVTDIYPRSFIFGIVIYLILIANIILFKKNLDKKRIRKVWIFIIVFTVVFFTPLHYSLITFMGKAGELLFCYLIGWYALSLLKFKLNPKAVIYLFFSILLWVNSIEDSVMLLFNEDDKIKYVEGIEQVLGGPHLINDLVKLSNSSGVSVNVFNWLLLVLAIFTFYKTLKKAKTPPLSKVRFYRYLKKLFDSVIDHTKNIKKTNNKTIK